MSEMPEKKPRVSVSMMTYNHEKFIAQAIEGVLMQETDFPIELLIHDDASTDRTAEIVREYEQKHPDIIKAIYQTENQYSQGRKPGLRNRARALGEYIALCEGDDYWTDPKKLQMQVDFMDAHPECSFCGHRVRIVDQDGVWDGTRYNPMNHNQAIFDLKRLLEQGYCIQTCSLLYRRHLAAMMPKWYSKIPAGDMGIYVHLAKQGLIGYLEDVMGDYRIHAGGIYQGESDLGKIERSLKSWKILRKAVPGEYKHLCTARVVSFHNAQFHNLNEAGYKFQAHIARLQVIRYGGASETLRKGVASSEKGKRGHALIWGLMTCLFAPHRRGGFILVASTLLGTKRVVV